MDFESFSGFDEFIVISIPPYLVDVFQCRDNIPLSKHIIFISKLQQTFYFKSSINFLHLWQLLPFIDTHEDLFIKLVSSIIFLYKVLSLSPKIILSNNLADVRPNLNIPWSTVVNLGSMILEIIILSKPIIEKSSGTLNPNCFAAFIAPIAIQSLQQNIAVGGFGFVSLCFTTFDIFNIAKNKAVVL